MTGYGPRDPLLVTKQHRANAAYWRNLGQQQGFLLCARCGQPIDLTDRKQGPRSLVVGHIIDRHLAKRLGMAEAQINDRANSQPECKTCSDSSGGQASAQLRAEQAGRIDYQARW